MSERFDRRFTFFGVTFPWIVALCFAVIAWFLRPSIPDPLGLHWAGQYADVRLDFLSFVLLSALSIGTIGSLCGLAAGARLPWRWLRRFLMGAAVGLSLFGAACAAAWLMGQQGAASADVGSVDLGVFAFGAGAALAFGTVMIFVYQPPPVWGRADEKALAEASSQHRGEPRIQFWLHPRASNFVFLTMLALLPGSLLLLVSPWVAAAWALLVVLVMASLFARVTIDGGHQQPPRLRLAIAGFVPLVSLRLATIRETSAVPIRVWSHSGPGPRLGRGKRQYLSQDGAAVLVRFTEHQRSRGLLLSVPADVQAGALASYLRNRARSSNNG